MTTIFFVLLYKSEIDHKVKPSEPYLLEYMNNFFSTLLVVPVGTLIVFFNNVVNVSIFLVVVFFFVSSVKNVTTLAQKTQCGMSDSKKSFRLFVDRTLQTRELCISYADC